MTNEDEKLTLSATGTTENGGDGRERKVHAFRYRSNP